MEIRGDQGPFFAGRQVLYDQQMYRFSGATRYGRRIVPLNAKRGWCNFAIMATATTPITVWLPATAIGQHRLSRCWRSIRCEIRPADGNECCGTGSDRSDAVAASDDDRLGGIEIQEIGNPWGQSRMGRIKVNNQPGSTMSAVIDGGVAILRGRELTFYECLTGKPQWMRHDVPPGSDI